MKTDESEKHINFVKEQTGNLKQVPTEKSILKLKIFIRFLKEFFAFMFILTSYFSFIYCYHN